MNECLSFTFGGKNYRITIQNNQLTLLSLVKSIVTLCGQVMKIIDCLLKIIKQKIISVSYVLTVCFLNKMEIGKE